MVTDGWKEEKLYTMIVRYDNNQIIMHWAAWMAVVYYRRTTIWEAYDHQSCLCICVLYLRMHVRMECRRWV